MNIEKINKVKDAVAKKYNCSSWDILVTLECANMDGEIDNEKLEPYINEAMHLYHQTEIDGGEKGFKERYPKKGELPKNDKLVFLVIVTGEKEIGYYKDGRWHHQYGIAFAQGVVEYWLEPITLPIQSVKQGELNINEAKNIIAQKYGYKSWDHFKNDSPDWKMVDRYYNEAFDLALSSLKAINKLTP